MQDLDHRLLRSLLAVLLRSITDHWLDFVQCLDMVPDMVDFLLIHFQAAEAHRLSRDLIRHFHQTGHFRMI